MKIECNDDCEYRNRFAPFCGYCLMNILREENAKHGIEENYDCVGKAGLVWSKYRKEDPRAEG